MKIQELYNIFLKYYRYSLALNDFKACSRFTVSRIFFPPLSENGNNIGFKLTLYIKIHRKYFFMQKFDQRKEGLKKMCSVYPPMIQKYLDIFDNTCNSTSLCLIVFLGCVL